MYDDEGFLNSNFDPGDLRYLVAGYVRSQIRARWGLEPWFQDTAVGSMWRLLRLASLGLADLNPDHNGALLEAARLLREDGAVEWRDLVDCDAPGAIRADPDPLPHPQRGQRAERCGTSAPTQPTTPFVPTRFQLRLLKALDGKALTGLRLEGALKCDRKQLHRDGIRPLRDRGLILNNRNVGGYYRPDKPPPQFAEWLGGN